MRTAALALALMATPALADGIPRGMGHDDNPAHWYESGCCNFQDCEPVEAGAIVPMEDGYHVAYLTSRGFMAKGIVKYSSGAVRPSRDEREHACASPARVLCIYLPFGS